MNRFGSALLRWGNAVCNALTPKPDFLVDTPQTYRGRRLDRTALEVIKELGFSLLFLILIAWIIGTYCADLRGSCHGRDGDGTEERLRAVSARRFSPRWAAMRNRADERGLFV